MEIDLHILRSQFETEDCFVRSLKSIRPFQLFKKIAYSDLVFGWFSSWHTFLPVLFAKISGKPIVLIVGGYDTASIKESSYGNQLVWYKRWITNWNIKQADALICNSNYIKQELHEINTYFSKKANVIHHGIQAIPYPTDSKSRIVLNIGNVSSENLLRKGILPFVETSKLLHEFKFIQFGKWRDDSYLTLKENAGKNCSILGLLNDEDALKWKQSASVYVQASSHEGFGMSVVESMQMGCVPVISKQGALPEVVRQYGIYLENNTKESIAEAILAADRKTDQERKEIAEFVNSEYSIEKRKNAIIQLVNKYL